MSRPARFFSRQMPPSFFRILIPGWIWIPLVLACTTSAGAAPPGFLEGHLTIISSREVQLADGNAPPLVAEIYAEYPLIIFSEDGKKEIRRVTGDANGNYRAALPPGVYFLDVQGHAPGHVRAKPRRFEVVSRETVRVDMDIDTGVR